jgi:hypothetical protein
VNEAAALRWHQTSSALQVISNTHFREALQQLWDVATWHLERGDPLTSQTQTKTTPLRQAVFLPSSWRLLTASQRPVKKRRTDTRSGALSESLEPTVGSSKSQWTTYRVTEIPNTYDEASFHHALRISLQLESHTTLTIHSFASNWSQQRIATITFSNTPSRLSSAGADDTRGKTTGLGVNIVHPLSTQTDTVCIDTHFTGFTPVSPLYNDEEHLIECVSRRELKTFTNLWSQLYCYTWLGKSCTWRI